MPLNKCLPQILTSGICLAWQGGKERQLQQKQLERESKDSLSAGPAAMQDIMEGLQLSKQFDTASQKLMMEISAMAESLNTGIGAIL